MQNTNKQAIHQLNQVMYNFDSEMVKHTLGHLCADSAIFHMPHPLGDAQGANQAYNIMYEPLYRAIPDLEKRCYILVSGNDNGSDWVGSAGYYTGTFWDDWLDIPFTGQQVTMRFHEFYRFESGKIVEAQILWDIPEVMHQANAWPMTPSLGKEGFSPAPASLDGVLLNPVKDGANNSAKASLNLVKDMLNHLGKFAQGGVEAMQLDTFWHPRCNWYGPSGIGACRGISGFRNWHQIPFLNALPNRRTIDGNDYLFADQNYVAFTAWPGMEMTVSGDGWLGIAPAHQKITLRSLDFWRCEAGLIRENWVLVDLLDAYHQLGVDVLARMREFNKAKSRAFSQ